MTVISTYCVSETDSLERALLNQGFPLERYRAQIETIGKKANNNMVGFAQFGSNDHKIKLCVCPKTIEKDEIALQGYLTKAFQIAARNPKEAKKIDHCLHDVSTEYAKQNKHVESLTELTQISLEKALEGIRKFVGGYTAFKSTQRNVVASSLKYRLNPQKNITELDSTKIHQTRREHKNTSPVIDYTLEVLRYFSKKRCNGLENGDLLRHKANQTSAYVRRRFVRGEQSVKVRKLATPSVRRLFSNKRALELYSFLLRLIGDLVDESEAGVSSSSLTAPDLYTFFVHPEKIYELYVYDHLDKKYPRRKVSHEPIKKYQIQPPNGSPPIKRNAEPDVVVDSSSGSRSLLIIDAKWKLLTSAVDIDFADIAKLERDTAVFDGAFAVLVYPQAPDHLLGKHSLHVGSSKPFDFYVKRLEF